jgi:transposase
MSVRLLLTDNAWEHIAAILALVKHPAGSPPVLSDRMFIEAVLSVARTGLPWRDLPAECGRWGAVDHRFRRWESRGVWRPLWDHLQGGAFKGAQDLCSDSTMVRAHQPAAGALQNPAAKRPRLWDALGVDVPPTSMLALETKRPVWRSSSPGANVMMPRAARPSWRNCPKNRRENRPSGTEAMTVITFATISKHRA